MFRAHCRCKAKYFELECLRNMQLKVFDREMHSVQYGFLLQACAERKTHQEGQLLHTHMLKTGAVDELNTFLYNKLLIMYTKCGKIGDARQVFDKIPIRNLFSWTSMIEGYAKLRYWEQALALFSQMHKAGVLPDNFILPVVIKVCAGLAALQKGREIHVYAIKSGLEPNLFSGSGLVSMYAKCGVLEDARKLFDKMAERNVVSWNAMIAGYVQSGYREEALQLFEEMQLDGLLPNVASWNAIIGGFVQNGNGDEALKLFYQMQRTGIQANYVTMASILPGCTSLTLGKEMHDYIMSNGLDINAFLGSSLVDMYVKCGSVEDARQVFDKMHERDVVSWTAMILGYAQSGQVDEALSLFHQMQLAGLKPDSTTWNVMIDGYASRGLHDEALKFFQDMELAGMRPDVITWNMMISRFAQNGHGEEALKLFQQMQSNGVKPNVKTWTAMIAGSSQNGQSEEALNLFRQMRLAGVKPNSITIASVIPACATLTSSLKGKGVHAYVRKHGFDSDLFVGSALVDMYAKCGNIEDACRIFYKMPERNVVSWNAMLSGYAMHGYGKNALMLFSQMKETGPKPNHATFTSLLSACSQAGLVTEGIQCFDQMSKDYEISLGIEHYAGMVKLLGLAGRLDEAHDFIKKMPLEPDPCVWGALLGGCRVHGNVVLAKCAAACLFELEPQNVGNYVVLSNIYAAAGKWDDVLKVRNLMKERGLKKTPGCSWIEVKNRVHAFFVGDRSHPQTKEIYAMLERLAKQMKQAGYVTDTNFMLWNVEEKEGIPCGHSERFAIAFGLINTCPGAPIHIIKNFCICSDCHTATKFISKIVGREIYVRDTHRFHHFKNGLCSRGDYW